VRKRAFIAKTASNFEVQSLPCKQRSVEEKTIKEDHSKRKVQILNFRMTLSLRASRVDHPHRYLETVVYSGALSPGPYVRGFDKE
jgi:hypothetical protein